MRTNRLAAVPLSIALTLGALVACGGTTSGGSGGSASLSGTVASTTFNPASQLAVVLPAASDTNCTSGPDGGQSCTSTTTGQAVVVLLTNRADATCALAQSEASSGNGEELASFDVLQLAVANETGNVATGTYPIASPTPTGTGASSTFSTTSATCGAGVNATATTGTITLTEVDAGHVTGTYNVTFGTQGSFSGSFDVSVCTLPDAGANPVSDGGLPACRQ